GKKATERTHFCFANENLEAYGVGTHRHTPEIEQILGLEGRLVFTPHLAPLNRGLLSTVTLPLAPGVKAPTTEELVDMYRTFYAESPLVTVMDAGVQPRTASVAGTCRAQVGVAVHPAGLIVATGAIDNLGKGAAGQAVQCANIVFGLPETTGLEEIANPV
ncbi:MAG: Asd/ArgC dimerization domain-containing protein, partial [Adlercreutzia sp.]|nr:Asd/ArgC dimerization domain-containing protein [Adlercreutzia sp.]